MSSGSHIVGISSEGRGDMPGGIGKVITQGMLFKYLVPHLQVRGEQAGGRGKGRGRGKRAGGGSREESRTRRVSYVKEGKEGGWRKREKEGGGGGGGGGRRGEEGERAFVLQG
eukprot:1115594-Rhodomonas_salina.5